MIEGGMERTLRYFVRMAQIYVLYTAVFSVAMSVYMWLLGSVSFEEMVASMPGSLLYFSGLMMFVNGRSAGLQCYSMLISFGCRRKNVFWGSLVMDILYAAECLAMYAGLNRILNPDEKTTGIFFALAFYLVIEGIANLAGIAMMKWGKIANVVMVVFIMFLSMGFGVWIGFGSSGSIALLEDIMDGKISAYWQEAAVLAGAVVCVVSNASGWKVLKRYEVKV